MEKVIHYCWFGGKPLSKMAKKCLKSWHKYLPDYEIIEWNESNFDVYMTKFSQKAYEEKKWAFVSDVARIYALKEYGGIYFDTDMEITKDVKERLDCGFLAGWESDYTVAAGVLGAEKSHPIIERLWQFYGKREFTVDDMYALSIPNILTTILIKEYGLSLNASINQNLKEGVSIYARDYFYPISSDDLPFLFTHNTCMIHHYVGSWTDSNNKGIWYKLTFGEKRGARILNGLVEGKKIVKKTGKFLLYPYVIYKRRKKSKVDYATWKKDFELQTVKNKKKDYLAICNDEWLGTSNATRELFENVISIGELWDEERISYITEYILKTGYKLVVFSAFAAGWDTLIERIKERKSDIQIKVIWHGGLAMNVEYYDWTMFERIFKLYNRGLLASIGFVKKSLYEFFKHKGYNVEFLMNTFHVDASKQGTVRKGEKLRIGLYASGDRWVKNFYNQLAAASMFEDALIDCVPMSDKAQKMAKIFKTEIGGVTNPIPRDKLLVRLGNNDINFYVTFSECAPMIPIESLELGVPCLTSNNHHYWQGTKLQEYLVVDENDDVMAIYRKAMYCIQNKEKILKLYSEWKREYDEDVQKLLKAFLDIR